VPSTLPPDAIVFDLDGVLWDTCGTCADAWNRVLARLEIAHPPVTAADVRAVAGRPHLDAVRRTFPGLTEHQVERISEETAREDNDAVAVHGGALYPGVREQVPELAGRLPLLIVSNCQQGYIEVFLEWSGLGAHFVDFECWGATGKPKADNLRAVIERNGLKRPIFIGDTDGDRVAAEDNRVPFVYAAYGFGEVSRYDHRIERFSELAALIDPLAR